MPMVPSTVRAGLVTRLATITGLRAYTEIPEVVSAPCALVDQLEIDFDASMGRGLDVAHVDILLVVQQLNQRSGLKALDGYLAGTGATTSVKASIEGDKTLGGACSDLRVLSASPGQYQSGGIDFLAYRYRLVIYG